MRFVRAEAAPVLKRRPGDVVNIVAALPGVSANEIFSASIYAADKERTKAYCHFGMGDPQWRKENAGEIKKALGILDTLFNHHVEWEACRYPNEMFRTMSEFLWHISDALAVEEAGPVPAPPDVPEIPVVKKRIYKTLLARPIGDFAFRPDRDVEMVHNAPPADARVLANWLMDNPPVDVQIPLPPVPPIAVPEE